jgi:hypothetical protein
MLRGPLRGCLGVVSLVLFSWVFIAQVGMALAESLIAKPDYIYVVIGESKTVNVSGGNFGGDSSIHSSDPSVAIAKMNAISKRVEITGVHEGHAIITVTDSDANSVDIRVKVFTVYMSS